MSIYWVTVVENNQLLLQEILAHLSLVTIFTFSPPECASVRTLDGAPPSVVALLECKYSH